MKGFITLIVSLCFISSCSQAPENNQIDETAESLSRIENGLRNSVQIKGQEPQLSSIEARLKHHNIPGASVAVAYDGELLWSKAYGMADISQSREMTTDTMLLAGSISKPVAALRALQLHDEGKFLLDENINTYLSSWQVPDNEFTEIEKVTLRRILNHSAGLTVWGFPGYDKGDEIPTTIDVLDGKGNTDPVRVYKTPGESWQYSGGGYTIMQLAISDIEQTPFEKSLQTHVLDPMNMSKSTFENPLPEKYHAIAAPGYRSNGDEVEGKWPIYPEMAAAGLWTTPTELLQYGIEIKRIVDTKEDGIISYASAVEMLSAGDNNHGLGPVVTEHSFSHGGADEGFRAHLIAWRNQPYTAVVMVNSDNGAIRSEILRAIATEYELPGYEIIEKSVVNLPRTELEKFVGDYDSGADGIFQISLDEQGLSVFVKDFDYRSELLPQSETIFFEPSNGIELTFIMEDEKPVQISWRERTANRID